MAIIICNAIMAFGVVLFLTVLRCVQILVYHPKENAWITIFRKGKQLLLNALRITI